MASASLPFCPFCHDQHDISVRSLLVLYIVGVISFYKKMTDNEQHELSNSNSAKAKSPVSKTLNFVLWFIKDQWFLVGIVFVTIISSQVQVPASQQATKQVIVSYLSGMYGSEAPSRSHTKAFSLSDFLCHGLHLGHQNSLEQLCKMEASHFHSSPMLSHGLSPCFCHRQSCCD